MKKFFVYLLALSLMLTLTAAAAGCGGNDAASSESLEEVSDQTEDITDEVPESAETNPADEENLPDPTSAGEDAVGGDGDEDMPEDTDEIISGNDSDDGAVRIMLRGESKL